LNYIEEEEKCHTTKPEKIYTIKSAIEQGPSSIPFSNDQDEDVEEKVLDRPCKRAFHFFSRRLKAISTLSRLPLRSSSSKMCSSNPSKQSSPPSASE